MYCIRQQWLEWTACLGLSLWGKAFHLLSISVMLVRGFFEDFFLSSWRNLLLFLVLEVFIMNRCCICLLLFLHQLIWSCDFSLLACQCDGLYWLILSIESDFHPWNKPQLVMVHNYFYMLLNFIYQYFVKDFCIYMQEGYWSVVFFPFGVLFFLVLVPG